MITLDQAYEILDEVVSTSHRSFKVVNTAMSLGRVVAEDQTSRVNLPAFDKATMDGYAILEGDNHQQYKILETISAGKVPTKLLSAGGVTKVMTGAPVPAGTAMVIPVEYAHEEPGTGIVTFIANYPNKRNIAKFGEDVRKGDVIISRGTLITPITIANLIACGITEISVYRRLQVAIVSTGDEIVTNFSELAPGKIMNSNGPMLEALAQKFNFKIVANVIIKDDLSATMAQFEILKNKQHLDMILISGGVSVGEFDFIEAALVKTGFKIHFNSVAIKPGRPITFAAKDDGRTLVFALPGNPIAVYLTFYLFVLRGYWRKFGIDNIHRSFILPLKSAYKRRDTERLEFVPLLIDDDGLTAVPIATHGSAHLAALLKCDGFFVVDQGVALVEKGTAVKCFWLK